MRQWRLNIGSKYNYSEPMDKNVALAAFKAIAETNDDKDISLVPVKYIVIDWANNVMLNGKRFRSFDDGWAYIYEHVLEEHFEDIYVVLESDAVKALIEFKKRK